MKLLRVFAALLGMILGLTVSTGAQADGLEAAGIPYAMRYAVCVFSKSPSKITECQPLKSELAAQAKPIIGRFYPRRRDQVYKRFGSYLIGIDEEGERLSVDRKTAAPVVVAYMKCLSDDMIAQSAYARGAFLDGLNAAKSCRALYDSQVAGPSRADKRSKMYMSQLRDLVGVEYPLGLAETTDINPVRGYAGLLWDNVPAD